jgi:hypothetical protein
MQFNIILTLGSKPVLEEGSIAVTELNCPAGFIVKHLIYIPNAVGLDLISSALTRHFVLPIVSASEQ